MSSGSDASESIHKRFRDLSADVREERIVRYVIKQLGLGRHLDDILSDAYLVEHTSDTTREELLQHPEVIKALEAQIKRQFADYEESVSHQEPGQDSTD
jgi:hypothetical protein